MKRLALVLAVVAVIAGLAGTAFAMSGSSPMSSTQRAAMTAKMGKVTNAQRVAAAKKLASIKSNSLLGRVLGALGVRAAAATLTPNATPDYYGVGNYANSPLPELDPIGNVMPGTGIRKFVDSLPGLGAGNANNLGQYIPVASANTTMYPGSDYYVIALGRYYEKLHSDLPPTELQGYVQLDPTTLATITPPSYLGPAIVANRDKPVRVRFINKLPTGTGGNLFLPVDTSIMGAGMGPNGTDYSQNRATLHLHGGLTPWISDGTPHQWTTPAGENTAYPKGVSVKNVPDMWFNPTTHSSVPTGSANATTDPGPGSMTFYYTNQQSARLMFYHDHSYGTTRLNVYAGEAAPYLLNDPVEQALVNGGQFKANGATVTVAPSTIPTEEIPLVIQDKTFVPKDSQLASQDPTWDKARWGGYGNLWLPHVYMPNQISGNDAFGNELGGVNAYGRWDYNPWFYPPIVPIAGGGTFGTPVANPLWGQVGQPAQNPGMPSPTIVPEAFMDTPLVNGTAYPFAKVGRKAYRFRILNASNDRTLNLQLYFAKSNTPDATDPVTGLPTLQKDSGEVSMTVAAPHPGDPNWPATWPTDGRDGGVPDPAVAGPSMIQIGNEAGFLPSATVLPNTPVGYEYFRRTITALNVTNKTLFLGPAERADVIVDFSQVPEGSKLIMYNDAPAPVPAFDSRLDYYTGDPDQTSSGGAPSTLPGCGPNTRTVMQFDVEGSTAATAFSLPNLQSALTQAYAATQDKPIVPEQVYGQDYNTTYQNNYVHATDTTMSFKPVGASQPATFTMLEKAIIEGFDMDYGRMNANLGGTLPNLGPQAGAATPYDYVDPPTDIATNTIPGTQIGALNDGTQIWRIDHQGVDTHAIHFHLFNVQLINRIALDGQLFYPDANELGWKETIRMNPGQDVIIALRPITPKLPFKLPDSVRPLNPALPLGATWVDQLGTTITNTMTNFGWEYVWHCHLLGHEENDMMRPFVLQVSPNAPSGLTAVASALSTSKPTVTLRWTNNATNPAQTNLYIEKSTSPTFAGPQSQFIPVNVANATSYVDTTALRTTYYYRIRAENTVAYSPWSNVVTVTTPGQVPLAPTGLHITGNTTTSIAVAWTLPTTGYARTGVRVQYSTNGGTTWTTINLAATATSRNITGLVHGSTYTIRVLSVGAYGTTASGTVSRKI